MKTSFLNLALAITFGLFTTFPVWAEGTDANYLSVLNGVSNRELPATAAAFVAQAAPTRQPMVTSDVVKAALEVNPASATSLVAGIAKVVPAMAPNAALAAVCQNPQQAPAIAAAAAEAAPQITRQIVKVICRALPNSSRLIAEAIYAKVPGAVQPILDGLADALPNKKDQLAELSANQPEGFKSLVSILNQADLPAVTPAGAAKPVVVGSKPLAAKTATKSSSGVTAFFTGGAASGGNPVNPPAPIDPGNGSPVPPGGRTEVFQNGP